MTYQKMTNDLIDYRKGTLTMDQLRKLRPTWRVPDKAVKFCVERAIEAGMVK